MKIIIEGCQPGWADAFDAEKEVIASVLAEFEPAVEHVGITAIGYVCDNLGWLPDHARAAATFSGSTPKPRDDRG